MDEPIEDVYFDWLYTKVTSTRGTTPSTSYRSLLFALHSTEFAWLISGDDNRAEEGKALRKEFIREYWGDDPDDLWYSMGCSVLEMFVAFARRATFQTELSTYDWFWIFLENLGLADISDSSYRANASRIGPALDTFIWRTYDRRGNGSMFPLKRSRKNQRTAEIWYQFCEYVVDNDIY